MHRKQLDALCRALRLVRRGNESLQGAEKAIAVETFQRTLDALVNVFVEHNANFNAQKFREEVHR